MPTYNFEFGKISTTVTKYRMNKGTSHDGGDSFLQDAITGILHFDGLVIKFLEMQ